MSHQVWCREGDKEPFLARHTVRVGDLDSVRQTAESWAAKAEITEVLIITTAIVGRLLKTGKRVLEIKGNIHPDELVPE